MAGWEAICPICLGHLPRGARACPVHGEPPDPLVGSILEESYRIARLLAWGGVGRIYQGEDIRLGRRVAVKILRPGVDANETAMGRFQREARAIAALDHQNIVTVHDIRKLPRGELCLVMELLEGETLQDRLQRLGPLPLSAAGRILTQAARALGAAHARGLVHRDVTPNNIMLISRDGRDDFVKILDFGLVKTRAGLGDDTAGTAKGEVVGTPAYMSPEQAHSRPVDHRADVYGLGMVTYAMVCGEPAFTGLPATVLMAHVRTPPQPPGYRRRDLPPDAEYAILRCLEKDPDDRLVAVEEFAALFSKALADSTRSSRALVIPDEPDRPDHVREHALGEGETGIGGMLSDATAVRPVSGEGDGSAPNDLEATWVERRVADLQVEPSTPPEDQTARLGGLRPLPISEEDDGQDQTAQMAVPGALQGTLPGDPDEGGSR